MQIFPIHGCIQLLTGPINTALLRDHLLSAPSCHQDCQVQLLVDPSRGPKAFPLCGVPMKCSSGSTARTPAAPESHTSGHSMRVNIKQVAETPCQFSERRDKGDKLFLTQQRSMSSSYSRGRHCCNPGETSFLLLVIVLEWRCADVLDGILHSLLEGTLCLVGPFWRLVVGVGRGLGVGRCGIVFCFARHCDCCHVCIERFG